MKEKSTITTLQAEDLLRQEQEDEDEAFMNETIRACQERTIEFFVNKEM